MNAMPEDPQEEEALSAESPVSAALQEGSEPQPEPHVDSQPTLEDSRTETRPRGIAPIWHSLVLVVAILAFSVWGAVRPDTGSANPLAPVQHLAHAAASDGSDPVRLIRYGLTGLLELAVVGWVIIGLRLRGVSFRSLFGRWPKGLNDVTKEAGIAAAFWLCSMAILVSFALSWNVVETWIYKHQASSQQGAASKAPTQSSSKSAPAPQKSPQQEQAEMAKQLMELAPANGIEIAAWGLLCLIVGFSEELIFRGYLQSQSISLLRSIPLSIVLTAVIFGAAHGYQGLRGIFLITIYGALFGCITLLRKNLFPGMLAHSWHDFSTGMMLALLRSSHLLDHLPAPK